MKLSNAGVVILSIVVLSALIANIANIISTEFVQEKRHSYAPSVSIGSSPNDIVWFVQISDLHLSIFQDVERSIELKEFCDLSLNFIKPSVVLASGDLTDAKQWDNVGSKQFEEEWKKYGNILNSCPVLKRTVWLDIRGNHDNFDVPGILSRRNFFRKYSAQGKIHDRSYLHTIVRDNKTYAFIGLDACPEQGLRRPFNFVGLLTKNQMSELKRLENESNKADFTVWFGHYPTSCILSQEPGIRTLIGAGKHSLAYLCGHFHSLLGLVPKMYTIQKEGFLELELADWKDNRMFRVAAIDHGLVSFVDIKHRDWPIILVTNPKHSTFQLFSKEPINSMKTSTHIRILVFSPSTLLSVRVKIDKGQWENCIETNMKGLFVLKWDPKLYSRGLHHIHVDVLDEDGRKKTITQPFSLDGTTMAFGVIPRLVLMLNFSTTLQILFGLSTAISVVPLCVLRYLNKKVLDDKRSLPALRSVFVRDWLRRIWIVSNIDRLFFPIVLYPLYIALGPWSVGELIEGNIGVIFIWGIFINGSYIPGSFTYGYGFVQLFLFQGPLVLITAYTLDQRMIGRRHETRENNNKIMKLVGFSLHNIPFLFLFVSQITMTYTFWLAYGTMSVLLGPIRLWPIILTLWSWILTNSIPIFKIRSAAAAWCKTEDYITRAVPT